MSSESSSDAELIEACLSGHAEAWEELVRRYAKLVYSVARRYHLDADDAADVFQNTWSALWERLSELRFRSNLGPWLLTVTGRLSYQQYQRRERQAARGGGNANLTDPLDPDALPEDQAVAAEDAARLRAALDQLPTRCRELLEYLFYDPRSPSYAEIGSYMGLSSHTIGPLRTRCLHELRAIVERIEQQTERRGH